MREIATTPEIDTLLRSGAAVAIGVSGGKDSCAVAIAINAYLDAIGHTGERLLIHSDLGRVEWADSLPTCQRLAQMLGMELVVVRRQAGDMLDRWWTRWSNNVERYQELACVKLILPWSTPSMRFCTSEMKTAVICRALVQRWPKQTILSVSGVRRDESQQRSKTPILKAQAKLVNKTNETTGYDWHPLVEWSEADVWQSLEERHFERHEAYRVYGSGRVSCAYCIMSSQADLRSAASCAANQQVYREMVDLEIVSTFAFQQHSWLGDVAPDLLDQRQRMLLQEAKERALVREQAEQRIPVHLFYHKNWPTCLPTMQEARLLADVRRIVAEAVGIPDMQFLDGECVLARYVDLIAQNPHALATTVVQDRIEILAETALPVQPDRNRPARKSKPRPAHPLAHDQLDLDHLLSSVTS